MSTRAFYALSDEERDYWIADWEIRRMECPDCGNPIDECSDPKRLWYPFRRICYATMEREAALAAYNELHGEDAAYHNGTFTSWSKTRSSSHPYGAGDGVSIGVAQMDVNPWDKFTTERDASPLPPSVSEQQIEPAHAADGGQAADGEGVSEPPLSEGEGDH